MALSPASTSAGTTPTGPDRSIPQELIDLALLAIRRGAQSVSIGHEGLGYDFPAPIGWMLWIHRVEHGAEGTADGDHAMITHQIGCDLGDIVAPAWLTEAAADGTEDAIVIEGGLELFETGLKNGWAMSYTREQREHGVWLRTCAREGFEDDLGMRHVLKGYAANYGWTPESTEPTSVEISLSIYPSNRRLPLDGESVSMIGDEYSDLDRAQFESMLQATAPGFAPVAYVDDELEEWVR